MAVDLTITQLATTTRSVTVLRGDPSYILECFRNLRRTGQLRLHLNQGGVSHIEWEQEISKETNSIDKEKNGR